MRKSGLLHPELTRVLTGMGHKDTLVVADAGLPITMGLERIDLALVPGVPGFLETAKAILSEFKVESAICASEIKERNPDVLNGLRELLGNIPLDFTSHEELKKMSRNATGIVRTGECTPYANVILVAEVTF